MQSSNGHLLPQPDNSKPKRHNAKLCPPAIRERIINGLANGDSIRSIARKLRRSPNTVVAIREEEWQRVEARKQILANQAERNALLAGEQITDALLKGKVPVTSLVPVYGVSVDKALSLRGEPSLVFKHEHFHRVSDDDLYAFAVARSKHREKPVKAKVIPETHLLVEKTRGKRRVDE